MHRSDHLSCLSISVSKACDDIDVTLERLGVDMIASASRIGGLSACVHRIGSDLSVDVKAKGGLRVSCSIICSVNKATESWMWDAGEIMYWDNNEIIALEWE